MHCCGTTTTTSTTTTTRTTTTTTTITTATTTTTIATTLTHIWQWSGDNVSNNKEGEKGESKDTTRRCHALSFNYAACQSELIRILLSACEGTKQGTTCRNMPKLVVTCHAQLESLDTGQRDKPARVPQCSGEKWCKRSACRRYSRTQGERVFRSVLKMKHDFQ